MPPPPTPPKRSAASRIVLFVVLGIVGLFCAFIGLGALVGDDPETVAETTADSTATGEVKATEATQATESAPTPKAADFKLTAKVTDKECFGSAGCNVDVEVKLSYSGPALSENDTWRVTYEITGDEDGPVIGNTEVVGTTYDVNPESLSTKSSKTKITVKVTDVEKLGL